jgi:hypothetical protein
MSRYMFHRSQNRKGKLGLILKYSNLSQFEEITMHYLTFIFRIEFAMTTAFEFTSKFIVIWVYNLIIAHNGDREPAST